jgi:small subunit ribosomal protein S6
MAFYENVFIARQDISASQVDTLADGFTAIIAEHGGQVTKREYWGLRNLTYRMKKNRKGHYVLFNLDAPPAAVSELERNMRINEDVLRYLTIRVEELEAGPSAVMQNRGRGDERGERGDRDRGDRGRRSFGDRGYGGDRDREPREPREAPAATTEAPGGEA